jgi:hypothetical protein
MNSTIPKLQAFSQCVHEPSMLPLLLIFAPFVPLDALGKAVRTCTSIQILAPPFRLTNLPSQAMAS